MTNILELFKRKKTDTPKTETAPPRLTTEDAIRAWESNQEKNKEGYKIVRGMDGKPVEIVTNDKGGESIFDLVVNGKKMMFQIGGPGRPIEQLLGELEFRQFANSDVFDGTYQLHGIQRLDATDLRPDHQGFLFGLPTEPQMDMEVRLAR